MNLLHGARVRRAAVAVAAGLALAMPSLARAQFVDAPAPSAYALRNVTVVRPDGSVQPGQTLVVRSGRIEALSRDAAVPGDARVLDGDSLYVYPGFVDAAGAIDFAFPRDTTDRARVRSWDAPRVVQGYLPSRRVIDYMTATGATGAAQRKQGVVAVAAHPALNEPLMPGRGVFVLLRPNALTPAQLVLEPALPPLMSLRGGRGVYPATQMGVIAWFRQTFLDAQRQTTLAQADNSGPSPMFDGDMAVLQDVLRTRGRVLFVANSADDIRRVFGLADEFGFRPAIVGGAEAWKVTDELKRRDVPVLVSVDFTKPRRWKPDEKPADGEDPKPLEPAAAREKAQLEDAYANAGRLAAAGVTFALVSGGNRDALRDGVLKAIEYGLGEADALRALTATPATLLGMPQIVRVQPGSAATFIVTDRPVLTKDARVVYTFVEGVFEKGADLRNGPASDTSSNGDVMNAAGTWSGEIVGPMTQRFTLKLTQDGATLSGTMESTEGSVPVTGTVSGSNLTLNARITVGGNSFDITLNGVVSGDEVKGQLETGMGSLEWTARRTAPGGQS